MMKSVLFLCVANSARSQLGEGVARALFGDAVHVQSAGSKPGTIHPLAVAALTERGLDASGQYSKSVETIDPATVDTVITLCAEEVCPVFLGGATRIHWPLADPAAGGGIEAFRAVRDEVERRLRAWRDSGFAAA